MQRTVRVNDSQVVMLAERARTDHSLAGYLRKRAADVNKWQMRWFLLYQNMMFYYESESSVRPAGVVLLEGSYCERLITASNIISTMNKGKDTSDKLYCFAITYRCENQRQYELGATSEGECNMWIDAIREASFNKLLLQKEELEQKHLHLLQVVESERTAKWHYTHQCEELSAEIKKMRLEHQSGIKKERRPMTSYSFNQSFSTGSLNLVGTEEAESAVPPTQEALELRKIKKVQSFFRGWLCRRRWKQIVEQYIKSPHAESMRKRNSLVFRMVECEEEYMEQMEVLVSCFLRPLRMAASSKKPPCTHEDVNSIFLNSETVLFLHQIFLKGLTTRMENWPTLVLGDLFDILLPMLSIYQEYVRNHHYSLQVLTECKQNTLFGALLDRLEHKPACQGRSLETFLTYPMHQVPRYIITLHELLAHTPHNHVERKSLQNARQQLEDLSRQMHDEVSETENLRKNLSVERMIVEGCDILLDVNQVFVRQGSLVQILTDRPRTQRSRLASFGSKSSDKEAFRHCYLFSNHLILTTRSSAGRLNLVPDIGKIPLVDAFLIEDPSDQSTTETDGATEPPGSAGPYQGRDFKVVADVRSTTLQQVWLHFVAPTVHEKTAWISDIGQCIENVHFSNLLHVTSSDTSSVTMPKYMRNDPKLFNDDVDIRFGPGLNSCKVPHIRYATPERLLERLTDLRFLSIDFLNTFLLTYRVFTDSVSVLEALKKVFYNADLPEAATAIARGSIMSLDAGTSRDDHNTLHHLFNMERRRSSASPRRTSGASSVSGYGSEASDRDRSHSYDSQGFAKYHWRCSIRKYEQEERELALINEGPNIVCQSPGPQVSQSPRKSVTIHVEAEADDDVDERSRLAIPTDIAASSSADTLTEGNALSSMNSPSNLSSVTLVGSNHSDLSAQDVRQQKVDPKAEVKLDEAKKDQSKMTVPTQGSPQEGERRKGRRKSSMEPLIEQSLKEGKEEEEDTVERIEVETQEEVTRVEEREPVMEEAARSSRSYSKSLFEVFGAKYGESIQSNESEATGSDAKSAKSSRASITATNITSSVIQFFQNYYTGRRSLYETDFEERSVSQRPSLQLDLPGNASKAGVVITSHRQANRSYGNQPIWSSTSTAAAAFAVATSACSNPPDQSPHQVKITPAPPEIPINRGGRLSTTSVNLLKANYREKGMRKESIMSSAATMRVINVLRHWVSKHAQDFEKDPKLKLMTIEFLDEIIYCPNLLPAEHKAATQLMRFISKDVPELQKTDFVKLLAPPESPCPADNIETLSALEIAEQMIYLDHKIFIAIGSEEFLGQAWMKSDKASRAPHIILLTKRFNDMSQLVLSEILRRTSVTNRVSVIEKWAAVADISRCLHNYNGVLQICSAFMNSSVYRLKKTWEKVSKTTKQSLEKLQALSSPDGRFRVLRDALYRCDPPCIPYLGMYLSDLSFIEEGTPTFTDDKLLNFSKMKMIAHVIRDIRHFQQTPYKIVPDARVANYLLDPSLLLDEDALYSMSLEIEPRTSRLTSAALFHSSSLGS